MLNGHVFHCIIIYWIKICLEPNCGQSSSNPEMAFKKFGAASRELEIISYYCQSKMKVNVLLNTKNI
jgi:hypothetical protein